MGTGQCKRKRKVRSKIQRQPLGVSLSFYAKPHTQNPTARLLPTRAHGLGTVCPPWRCAEGGAHRRAAVWQAGCARPRSSRSLYSPLVLSYNTHPFVGALGLKLRLLVDGRVWGAYLYRHAARIPIEQTTETSLFITRHKRNKSVFRFVLFFRTLLLTVVLNVGSLDGLYCQENVCTVMSMVRRYIASFWS